MRQKPGTKQSHGEKVVKDVRRATRKQYSAEEKIRIVLDGLKGLAQGASYNVVAIDEGSTEEAREALLATLQIAKYKAPLLVWRPVLAALHARSVEQVTVGQTVGVICHTGYGISIQKLQIITDATGAVAPERRSAGQEISCPLGYASLVALTREAALKGEKLGTRTAHRVLAHSVGRAALGMPVSEELLRAANADWEILDLRSFDVTNGVTDLPALPNLADFDVLLVESLAQGKARETLLSWVSGNLPGPVTGLGADAVALGALEAARRSANGQPVYFDLLPKLSTIVFGQGGAASFDLIRPGETVRAGEIYRSPERAQFAIPKGQPQISVFLKKEGQPNPRKAEIQLGAPAARQSRVELSVEQKPAAGRAKISLESRDLGRSCLIDWDGASPDERTWDEIIADLTPKVSMPNRLVLPSGMQAWEDTDSSAGLSSLLAAEIRSTEIDWETLAHGLPPLKWSSAMFRKTEEDHGKQATEARRDCHQVTAG